jgi:hypothetical protein
MRIALKVGETFHWLAGAPGVSPRTHSWAADFQLTPQSVVQISQFVRGVHAKPIDRGNLLQELRFSTTRQFATPAEALLWCLDYDGDFPRAGELVFDAIAPNGDVSRRKMLTTVVDPPSRRIIGATALVDYSVKGGQVEVATPPSAASGTVTVTGAPVENNTVTVAGQVFTWKNSPLGLYQIHTDSPSFPSSEATKLRTAINGAGLGVTATALAAVVTITAPQGAVGNTYNLAASGPFTVSGAFLTGGAD